MYIGDLHIHSRYSRATSRDCTPEYLELWARKKGIDIVGTGDFTHPAWREELAEKLEPAEDGLYVLKEEYRIKDGTPDAARPRFVVTGEISSIYKKLDRVRKVHSLLLLPGLEDADRLARRLELVGNIHSDGRPILGLDCRDLLEIMLETCERAVYVPAHIWTPHFSLFGAFSGFDRIEDCFEDLTPYIHALETGLSSDPPMNWRVPALDSYHLISNSDAHSPAKLGREANLFDIELSFDGLSRAVNRGEGLAGTLEFFPEEGKYHFDGHRKCGLCLPPEEAHRYGNLCPVCGKKLTVGVLHRVEELADRPEGNPEGNPKGNPKGYRPPEAPMFESLVPLPEVIAASTGNSAAGKKVREQYEKLLRSLGAEFSILRDIPLEDIRRAAGPLVTEGIKRLREGRVERTPGFDGQYGTIRLLSEGEISELEGQLCFFTPDELLLQEKRQEKSREKRQETDGGGPRTEAGDSAAEEGLDAESASGRKEKMSGGAESGRGADPDAGPNTAERKELPLNPAQQEAVCAKERAVAVIAGPGTGKTKTLLAHLTHMLEERKEDPSKIAAVTFTDKAAKELKERLEKLPGGKAAAKKLQVGTFHSICSRLLAENGVSFFIADEGLREELAERTRKRFDLKLQTGRLLREISVCKSGMEGRTGGETVTEQVLTFYQEQLREAGAFDYDDLLLETLSLCERTETGARGAGPFSCLLVDEFQDINPVQYRLIQAWNREGRELFVIGDPDQSIYGFRGSDAHCFERLSADYPELRTIRLTDHYRSTPEILSGALAMIEKNGGEKRRMDALRKSGPPIRMVTASDERNEAIFVAKEINRLIGGIDMLDVEEGENRSERGVRSFSDIAVLYRTHRQARLLEYCLRQEGIPYIVAGREDFLTDRNVRGALYFFQYALHPEEKTAGALAERLTGLSSEEAGGEKLALLLEKYRKRVRKAKPVKLLEEWAQDRKLPEEEPLKKLTDMSVLYSSMEEFLHTLTFGEDGDIRRNGGRKFLSDAVALMTFHGAKGLEFPAVFLYGMRKGLVPFETAAGKTDLEEERRLFYVGMTRAKDELILTVSGEESGFLKNVPEHAARRETAVKERPAQEAMQLSLFDFMA